MAITKNAKKAHRASLRKRVFNVRRARAVTATTKVTMKLLAADPNAANASLAAAYKAIDKAAKRGIVKPNAAARKKSRLARAVKRAAGR